MKRLGLLLLVCLLGASAYAVPAPATLKMKVAIGLGFQLCPERKTLPSLQDAYLCSGLSGVPRVMEFELQNKPAAQPDWLFYEAPYTTSVQFHDITVTLEALVMYSKVNGSTQGYVDGRLISTRNGVSSQPIYFRASAEGGLEKLAYSSTYGAMTVFPVGKANDEFSPYVVIDGVH